MGVKLVSENQKVVVVAAAEARNQRVNGKLTVTKSLERNSVGYR
jgi:hypothetical protein